MPSSCQYITATALAGCLTDLRLDHQAQTGEASLCCPIDFQGFSGHFPEAPVLPAVMQLLAVRLVAESVIEGRLNPASVERLKFKGMVNPAEAVRVRVHLKDRPEGVAGEFTLDREGTPIASGTIIFHLAARED